MINYVSRMHARTLDALNVHDLQFYAPKASDSTADPPLYAAAQASINLEQLHVEQED